MSHPAERTRFDDTNPDQTPFDGNGRDPMSAVTGYLVGRAFLGGLPPGPPGGRARPMRGASRPTSRGLAETLAQVRGPASAVALSDLDGPVEAHGAEVAGTLRKAPVRSARTCTKR
jgi:hypothetical protein